jgi:hypothetical protein
MEIYLATEQHGTGTENRIAKDKVFTTLFISVGPKIPRPLLGTKVREECIQKSAELTIRGDSP